MRLSRRAILPLLAACALSGCASIIPPPPEASPPATKPAAGATSAAPSATAGSRVATVTGTGRFGLSIRKAPGLSADRVATVPDGFQAAVVSGPVGQDGADWYQLAAADVSGWASAAYLTVASGTPVPATPVAAPPSSVTTPLAGIISQLNRESNYDVGGNGIFVEARVKGALDHLKDSPTASALLQKTAPAYLRITVDHFPATSEGGEFSTLGHSIKISDVVLQENLDVQSTVVSHELQHAADILVDHASPETSQDCVNLELRAFRTQEKVWLELTKPTPPQTRLERELDDLSHSVDSPTFAQQLAKLYTSECGRYSAPN